MAVRSDVSVRYDLSPRLAEVELGSNEITVQDSHDTLTSIQDSEEGAQFPDLVDTAGGETLGGGVFVGLTTTLDNVQYAPSATSPRTTGTVTTGDASGVTLIDSGATFITSGVLRGDWVINFTDQSVSEILSVDSETQLTTRGLRDGTGNTFDVSDAYKVWEVDQFKLDGGNFVAVDSLDAPIEPLFSSFGRFLIKTSASSATSLDSEAIQFASYAESSVWMNVANGVAGTVYPIGTSRSPVNNTTDAQAIADAKGLETIRITDNVTVDVGPDHTNMLWIGRSPRTTHLIIPDSGLATVAGGEYRNMLLTGPLSGGTYITSVAMKGVDNFAGHAEQCVLRADLYPGLSYSVRGNGAGIMMLNKCSAVDAFNVGAPAVIDCNGDSMVAARQFTGEMKIVNKTGTKNMSIDMVAGTLELDSTVTGACTIYIRGVGKLIDNSGPNVTIVNDLVDGAFQQDMSFDGAVHIDAVNGTAGTRYPQGTMLYPVNNFDDAVTVANLHNITTLHLVSDFTIPASANLTGFHIVGEGRRLTTVSIDQDATLEECIIRDCYVTGVLDNESTLVHCTAEDVELRNGNLEDCTLLGTITLAGNVNAVAKIIDCWSGVPGTSTPIIDMGGAAGGLSVRGYHGGLTLRNKSGTSSVSVDMASGQLILEATVTAGTIVARGIGKLLNSSVGATVVDELVDARRLTLIEKIQRNKLETDPTAGTLTIYDDDGVTPLITSVIYEDIAGTQTYRGQGVDRRERLQ